MYVYVCLTFVLVVQVVIVFPVNWVLSAMVNLCTPLLHLRDCVCVCVQICVCVYLLMFVLVVQVVIVFPVNWVLSAMVNLFTPLLHKETMDKGKMLQKGEINQGLREYQFMCVYTDKQK